MASVVGVDPAPGLLEKARAAGGGMSNLSFREGDGRSLPFEGATFDVVTFDSNEFGEWTPGNGRLAVGGGMTFIQTGNIDFFTRQPVDLTLPWWEY